MGIDIKRVRGWIASEDDIDHEKESQEVYDARIERLVRGFLLAMAAELGSLDHSRPAMHVVEPKVVGGQA